MKKKTIIILSCIGGILLLVIIAAIVLLGYIYGGVKKVNISDEEFGITEGASEIYSESSPESKNEPADDITNLVFLGIDTEENRSDVMMVISINRTDNSVDVISILRDSKVSIEGCKWQTKIGYAYKWNGSAFAVKTINQNFNTNINQYITMDFTDMIQVIDYLEGVEIVVSQEEADEINYITQKDFDYEENDAVAGNNLLNGAQAVAFSRIRDLDGDDYRASRQQKVLSAMLEKVKVMPKLKMFKLIYLITKTTETTLSLSEIIAFTTMDIANLELNTYTIPDPVYEIGVEGGWEEVEDWEDTEYNKIDPVQWVWIYDLDQAGKRLNEIIE